MQELELLAPARTADIGIAAIDCGADAVYIAGPAFGARQAAGNSIGDIGRLCEYAHRFGVRIFAALNTIIYDDEYDRACRMMEELQSAGADAIIIQDLGLTAMAMELSGIGTSVKIPLHASTQCAVRTPERAVFLESLGFSRLILERELSLEQVRAIRRSVGCELEFFVHGALCVCYSGQCYISENISGRSANRGACIQACRSLYDLEDESGRKLVSNKPLLSLKDYNLKHRLKDLAECGVTSFKIEGRLKNISYVRNIVRDYSLALDELVSEYPDMYRRSSFGKSERGFVPAPEKTFNRGYTELYLDGKKGQWASVRAAKSLGEPVGTVEVTNAGKSGFRIRNPKPGLRLANGDGFCFVTPGQEVIGFRGDVCEGLTVRCKPIPELFTGAVLYRNIDQAFERKLETELPMRMITVHILLTPVRSADGNVIVHAVARSEDGRSVEGTLGEGAGLSDNSENMRRTLLTQLAKSAGHYLFSAEMAPADMLPFLPVSAVNAFRRELAEKLDSIPCRCLPLRGGTPSGTVRYYAEAVTYKDNIANRVAGRLMSFAGARDVEPAYELTHRPGAELMRTRYCIRYQFGRCPLHHRQSWPSRLFLNNNGKRFELGFDCRNCEMTVARKEEF